MSNFYRTDFKRLILLLLPTFLRKGVLASILFAGSAPMRLLQTKLIEQRDKVLFRLNHNGQIYLLCDAINLTFDKEYYEYHPKAPRITITDYPIGPFETIAHKRSLQISQLIPERKDGAFMIFKRFHNIFYLNAPLEFRDKEAEIKFFIDEYKLASKKYIINYL